MKYDVAAYIWPAYTGYEMRTRQFWPEGMGEWQTVRSAVKRYPEHNWPRRPLWGYVNEADPNVMEMEIDVAADHGVNVFIYDWYWYDRRPFLENCLNDGYLKAKNNDRVKFYLMWANHNANYTWDTRISHLQDSVIWDAAVDRREFEVVCDRIIEKYFHNPSYYTIDNNPVFMIYDLANLIKGLGGVDATRKALEWFRGRAVQSGLSGLHLQAVIWGENNMNLSGVDSGTSVSDNEIVRILGFDSVTHYQFCHFADMDRDYNEIMANVLGEWKRLDQTLGLPYFPHISLGWDNSPRFKELLGPVVKNNTPENIAVALRKAKDYADNHPNQRKLITINSWNEWTETSYLQPDDLYGYGYLEAVKSIFG